MEISRYLHQVVILSKFMMAYTVVLSLKVVDGLGNGRPLHAESFLIAMRILTLVYVAIFSESVVCLITDAVFLIFIITYTLKIITTTHKYDFCVDR